MSRMMTTSPLPFARAIALHSLGWLVAANLVGLWLGATLLWPALGNLLAPLTWGRWTPLHMTWHLYGWCALPVVGGLLAWCLDAGRPISLRHARLALGAWSIALALGGVSWLGGTVSGKLFLEWHGWARPLLPIAMTLLWVVLTWHTFGRWQTLSVWDRRLRVGLLAGLAVVPIIIYWAAGRGMYHPVNPGSGGATGAAVLGSTLGIITIFMFVPRLLGVSSRRTTAPLWWMLAASWLVFAASDRGNVSHHAIAQIAALATLLFWVPLVPLFWRWHDWRQEARPWLRAAAVWWTLLVITGWISFLPGVSEEFKFTHALVGHAHLAMAGLLTSVNAVILITLTEQGPNRIVFWLWQGGCGLYIASMLGLGWGETRHVAELFRGETWTQALLGVRLVAGLAMAAASARWLALFVRV